MTLIPWKPFGEMDNFFGDDWFLPVMPRQGEPAMDVYETNTSVVARISVPGVDPDKVEVSVKDNVLSVRGSSEEKKEEKEKGYLRREIRRGSFERIVRLPVDVKEAGIEATYEKGMLEIVMPKAEPRRTEAKKVAIKVKK